MRVAAVLQTAKDLVFASIFPLFCIGCQKEGAGLCTECALGIGSEAQYFCPICLNELGFWGACPSHQRPQGLDGVFVLAPHSNKIARRALHALKYGYIESIGIVLGRLLADALMAQKEFYYQNHVVLVPVPMHNKRMVKRDFNQAKRIAQGIEERAGTAYLDDGLLVRTRHTKEQAKLARVQRLVNVKNAFEIKKSWNGEVPEFVVLVDDVSTTGATLRECASVLKQIGVKKVFSVAVAHGR